MSSIKGCVAQGGTRPAALLITMSISPIKTVFLLGQIMVLNTWASVIFDFAIISGMLQGRRSALQNSVEWCHVFLNGMLDVRFLPNSC